MRNYRTEKSRKQIVKQFRDAVAITDRLAEIGRLKQKVNRLITDRLSPGSINDNDLKREVME